jgi:signal transduction histidine kinase
MFYPGNFNLRTKLRFLILLVAALTFVNAWFVFNYTNASYKNLNQLRDVLFPNSDLLASVNESFLKQLSIYEKALINDEKIILTKSQEYKDSIQEGLERLKFKSIRFNKLRIKIKNLQKLHLTFSNKAETIYPQYINNQYDKKLQLEVRKLGLDQQDLKILLGAIHADLNILIDDFLETETQKAKSTSLSSITVSIALILLAAYIIYYFTVSLFKRLYLLENTSNQLNVSLKEPVPIMGKDELGILSQSLENLRVNLNERNQEMTMQKNTAEAALKAKGEFLANMSHEIRTPMNTILGMIDNLSDTELNENQKEFISSCKFTGRNLLTIINDILNLSKIEAGQFIVNENNFSLKVLVRELQNNFDSIVNEKNLNLSIEVSHTVPEWLYGGDVEFWQILVNIIGNAIKFTNDGFVKVKFTKLDNFGSADKVDLKITVEDSGIGMSPELSKNIFQVFKQGDASYSKKFAGTGLGMSITKKLLKLMKGTIEIDSQVNTGSTFTIYLSFMTGKEETKSEIEGFHTQASFFDFQNITKPNVLIVEDNEDNQHLMKIYMSKADFDYDFANDGLEAVEKFKNGTFNIIFMDIQMPVVDGYEATQLIRKHEKENNTNRTPIIALSAYIQQEDIERSFHSGCDAYLTKPISKQNLFNVIKRLC